MSVEARCPFCYSNRIIEKSSSDKKEYTCFNCGLDFNEDYLLFTNARERRKKVIRKED